MNFVAGETKPSMTRWKLTPPYSVFVGRAEVKNDIKPDIPLAHFSCVRPPFCCSDFEEGIATRCIRVGEEPSQCCNLHSLLAVYPCAQNFYHELPTYLPTTCLHGRKYIHTCTYIQYLRQFPTQENAVV